MLQSLSSSYSWFENRIFCQTSWTQQIKIGLPVHVNSEIKPLTDRFEKKKKKIPIRSIVLLNYQDKQQNLYILLDTCCQTPNSTGGIKRGIVILSSFLKTARAPNWTLAKFHAFTGKSSVPIVPNISWTEVGVKLHLPTSLPGKCTVCATPTGPSRWLPSAPPVM